jgi:hypothetical protein
MTIPKLRMADPAGRKRVAQIRWNRRDILHAMIWSLLIAVSTIWIAKWFSTLAF